MTPGSPVGYQQVNSEGEAGTMRGTFAAVLIAVNASELFTQDVEDYSNIVDGDWQPATPATQPAKRTPVAQPAMMEPDPGPRPDDELTITETSAREFIAAAAEMLETDEVTVKTRLKALGYTAVSKDAKVRLTAYRQLKADLGENVQNELFGDAEPVTVMSGAYKEE